MFGWQVEGWVRQEQEQARREAVPRSCAAGALSAGFHEPGTGRNPLSAEVTPCLYPYLFIQARLPQYTPIYCVLVGVLAYTPAYVFPLVTPALAFSYDVPCLKSYLPGSKTYTTSVISLIYLTPSKYMAFCEACTRSLQELPSVFLEISVDLVVSSNARSIMLVRGSNRDLTANILRDNTVIEHEKNRVGISRVCTNFSLVTEVDKYEDSS